MADCLPIQDIINSYKSMIPSITGSLPEYNADLITAMVTAIISPFKSLMETLDAFIGTLQPPLNLDINLDIPSISLATLAEISGVWNSIEYPIMSLSEKFSAIMTAFINSLLAPISDMFDAINNISIPGVPTINFGIDAIINTIKNLMPTIQIPTLPEPPYLPDYDGYFTALLTGLFGALIAPIEDILSSLPGLPCSA